MYYTYHDPRDHTDIYSTHTSSCIKHLNHNSTSFAVLFQATYRCCSQINSTWKLIVRLDGIKSFGAWASKTGCPPINEIVKARSCISSIGLSKMCKTKTLLAELSLEMIRCRPLISPGQWSESLQMGASSYIGLDWSETSGFRTYQK